MGGTRHTHTIDPSASFSIHGDPLSSQIYSWENNLDERWWNWRFFQLHFALHYLARDNQVFKCIHIQQHLRCSFNHSLTYRDSFFFFFASDFLYDITLLKWWICWWHRELKVLPFGWYKAPSLCGSLDAMFYSDDASVTRVPDEHVSHRSGGTNWAVLLSQCEKHNKRCSHLI